MPPLLTVRDVASTLSVSRARAYEIMREMQHVLMGRSVRVTARAGGVCPAEYRWLRVIDGGKTKPGIASAPGAPKIAREKPVKPAPRKMEQMKLFDD